MLIESTFIVTYNQFMLSCVVKIVS